MRPSAMAAFVMMPALLIACQAGGDTQVYEDLIVSKVPVSNALAASTRFMGCKTRNAEVACSECQVTLHQKNEAEYISEYIAYATRYDHKLNTNTDEPELSVTHEADSETFVGDATANANPANVFRDAEDWCANAAGRNTNYVLVKPLSDD